MCIYRHHPLIEGMLLLLPEDPPWTDAELERWLAGFEANVRLLYDIQPTPAAAAEPERTVTNEYGYFAELEARRRALQGPPGVIRIRPFVEVPDEHAAALEADAERAAALEADAERAAALEAERYDLEQLERERAGTPKPTAVPEIAERDPLEYDRAGRYVRTLECPHPSPGALREVCGQTCRGEMGLLGHLSGTHNLRGQARHVQAQRRALVDEAIARARGEITDTPPESPDPAPSATVRPETAADDDWEGPAPTGDVEAIRTKATEANADLAAREVDRRAGRSLPKPEPLNRDALTGLMAEHTATWRVVDGVETLVDVEPPLFDGQALLCPAPTSIDTVCGQPIADAIILDRHLREVHGLDDDEGRRRVRLVDEALEDLDARIATAAAGDSATIDATTTAATEGTTR